MAARTITIAGQAASATLPSDLDDRLRTIAGISGAEMSRALGSFCIASTLAAALIPLLEEAPSRAELARAIAKEGVGKVRLALLEIYGGAKAKPAAPDEPELTVERYCDLYLEGEGRDDPAMLQFAVNNGEAIEAEFKRRNDLALAASKKGGAGGKTKK